jgi:hypothetical protein
MRQWRDDDVMKDGVVNMYGMAHLLLHGDGKHNYADDNEVVGEEEDSVDNTGREDDGSTPIRGAAVDTMMKDGTMVAAMGNLSFPLQLMPDVANRPATTMTVYSEYRPLLYYHQRHLVQGMSTMMVIMMLDTHQFHQQHQYC